VTAHDSLDGRLLAILPIQTLGSSNTPRFNHPVFIVSAPFAGSYALSETFAACPAFRALKGEAPWLIESIPELCQGANGVGSDRLTKENPTNPIALRDRAIHFARLGDAEGVNSVRGSFPLCCVQEA